MRFAIGLPNVKEYADPALLVRLAVAAETAGWDGVFLWDHLLYRDESDDVADPWVAISAIAQETTTLRVGAMVAALARRRPWVVARQAATVDRLSNGRLIFGAGLGSLPAEFALFDEEPDERIRAEKLDESLDVITGLWSGEKVTYRGRHYTVGPVQFVPTPIQSPRMPVWIGGKWPNLRPFRRAARWDGLFATHDSVGHNETMTVEQLSEIVEFTHRHLAEDATGFDVVIEGQTTGENRERDIAAVRAYERAGLTWWVEKLGWFRGSVEEMRFRITQGPPKAG